MFDTAKTWLKQQGMDDMRGPANPSMNDECGLLIDGFDSHPVILMTYNPRYYQDLYEGYGLQKVKDLHAYILDQNTFVSDNCFASHYLTSFGECLPDYTHPFHLAGENVVPPGLEPGIQA